MTATHGDGILRVAVDGVDGSGKTTFADGLCREFRAADRTVFHVSLDDFHHQQHIRYRRGRTSAEGFWLDSYNYSAFTAHVLEPLAPGGSTQFRAKHHDVASDNLLDHPAQTAPPGSILIVDGMFLHRAELRDEWDFSIFLDVPFAITAARMADRDGTHPDPEHPSMTRYVGGQQLYFADSHPAARADLVVDNSDPAYPAVIAANQASYHRPGRS